MQSCQNVDSGYFLLRMSDRHHGGGSSSSAPTFTRSPAARFLSPARPWPHPARCTRLERAAALFPTPHNAAGDVNGPFVIPSGTWHVSQ